MEYNYQYVTGMGGAVLDTCIKRLPDNAIIPFDPANMDYQEYLLWLEAGNTPLPPSA
jgi:hypothetical protein